MADETPNERLASIFQRISQLLELTGADRFRVIAHDRAARVVESRHEDLCALALAQGMKPLTAIEGIGPKIAEKILEFARTGEVAEEKELLAAIPAGLLGVLQIPGLGPKTVGALWKTRNVTDVASLKAIIEDGSIMDVPRMGAKTVENIRRAIAFAERAGERTPIGLAMPIAEEMVARLSRVPGVTRASFAGSLRRGRETVGDLDFLVSTSDPAAVRESFSTQHEVTQVLSKGESKCSVRLDVDGRQIQADLRIVPEASFGAALLYFTGSKEHNVRMRERAQKLGMTLNEYGLYRADPDPTPPHHRGVPPLAGAAENECFEVLRLPYAPPELREERDIDEPVPDDLIQLADIKAELHAHTTASDGSLTIEELALAACARGFHTIAVTDHSQSSVIANGLKPERLLRHIEAVREAAARVRGITILVGSEVDILADGSLDYDDELLAKLDVVVASPHASLKQERDAATARMLRAIRHPLVHIIGHPTGRIVGRREGFHPDISALAAAAAEHRVALEVNCNWMRLDLCDTHVRAALAAGGERALIALDCDVHRSGDFANLRYGVATARRGGLTRPRCVNAWDAATLHDWLRSKR